MKLIAFLRIFSNVFSCHSLDMNGVDREIIGHSLNIAPGSVPIEQKKRGEGKRQKQGNQGRSSKASRSWNSKGDDLPNIDSKPR